MPSTQKSKDELRKEQERQEAAPARKKSRKAKGEEAPEPAKPEQQTNAEKLQALIEKGKKAGKLTSKEMMVLDDMNLEQEQLDWFYDQLENNGIDYSGEDMLPVLDADDLGPDIKELEELEEVTEEELIETESTVDSFATDDPVRMTSRKSAR